MLDKGYYSLKRFKADFITAKKTNEVNPIVEEQMRRAIEDVCKVEEFQMTRLKAESAIVMLQNTNFI